MFLSEVKAILEDLRPRELHVIWWDTEAVLETVEDLDDLEMLIQKEVPGGGGTVYDCALDLIEAEGLEPDVVICMTDGWVSCSRREVPYPHVTLTTGSDLPFGRNIHVK